MYALQYLPLFFILALAYQVFLLDVPCLADDFVPLVSVSGQANVSNAVRLHHSKINTTARTRGKNSPVTIFVLQYYSALNVIHLIIKKM